ncbi:hypothetical protein HY949_02835 [Candidatus Gottesmanbacteria bacterium]|nr:hypothetical protein [Candidatus Gottesmanbacteria bacterium]
MGTRTYLLIAGIVVVGGALSVLAWYAGKGKLSLTAIPKTLTTTTFGSFLGFLPGIKTVPKQIASLPNPVTKVVGRVNKLKGDVLTVTQRFPDGDILFTVTITPDTQIIKPRPFIPYLLKTVHADVADVAAPGDLTEGTLVTVTTAKDLRETGVGKPVPASVVEITVYNTSIQGMIAQINGNTFTMNAAVPALLPNIPTTLIDQTKERTYAVTFATGSTELSRKIAGRGTRVHPDELKPGAVVTVYATTDVTLLNSVPAVLIRFGDQ